MTSKFYLSVITLCNDEDDETVLSFYQTSWKSTPNNEIFLRSIDNPNFSLSGPNDFMFATIGDNWPELSEYPEEEEPMPEPRPNKTRQTWARINPIRRARNLIRRIL